MNCCQVVIPIAVFQSAQPGFGFRTFFGFVVIFVLAPVLDIIIGMDCGNQTKGQQKALNKEEKFRWLTLLCAPGILASLLFGAYLANHGQLSKLEFIGMSLSVGLITGDIGIVAGHELCHKATKLERLAGRFLLCAVSYGHFYVEHTLGHHKDVATDHDPATARYGESFYSFLPRVIIGVSQHACMLSHTTTMSVRN